MKLIQKQCCSKLYPQTEVVDIFEIAEMSRIFPLTSLRYCREKTGYLSCKEKLINAKSNSYSSKNAVRGRPFAEDRYRTCH